MNSKYFQKFVFRRECLKLHRKRVTRHGRKVGLTSGSNRWPLRAPPPPPPPKQSRAFRHLLSSCSATTARANDSRKRVSVMMDDI